MGLRNDISNAMVMISDDDYNDYNDYDYDDDDKMAMPTTMMITTMGCVLGKTDGESGKQHPCTGLTCLPARHSWKYRVFFYTGPPLKS